MGKECEMIIYEMAATFAEVPPAELPAGLDIGRTICLDGEKKFEDINLKNCRPRIRLRSGYIVLLHPHEFSHSNSYIPPTPPIYKIKDAGT